jgi:speckle-type POZ protein
MILAGKLSQPKNILNINLPEKYRAMGVINLTNMKYAEQNYLAHDGSLTIHCNITVTSMTCVATSVGDVTPTPPPDIAHHLEELLASEKVSDVTFLVEEKEIRTHKLVIATRSPALYELVATANKDDCPIIAINDMKAAAFEAVLRFIYTGELPPMKDTSDNANRSYFMHEGSDDAGDGDDVLAVGDMMGAASRFRLDKMKAKCEMLLAESVLKENARMTLKLACNHGCSKLEDYCAEFMSSEYASNYRRRFRNYTLQRMFYSCSRENKKFGL